MSALEAQHVLLPLPEELFLVFLVRDVVVFLIRDRDRLAVKRWKGESRRWAGFGYRGSLLDDGV